MKVHLLGGIAAAALALSAIPAAASEWILNYTASSGLPATAALDITVSDIVNAVGGHDLTGITGSVDGDVITGFEPSSNSPFVVLSADGLFNFDQVFYFTAPHVDNAGLLFNSATFEYNLFATTTGDPNSPVELYRSDHRSYVNNSAGTLSVAGVPEPASWALMIAGFGGVGTILRSRRRFIVPV
jgi:hypothetical protein